MPASKTSDSPSPRRHTKTSIATLVAICALAAGAQALAPASAGAMAAVEAGGCLAIRIGDGLIEWRTSGGEVCTPTNEDYLRALANGGFGDRYNVTDLPGRYPGLDLPDNRAGGVPDRDGQHFGDGLGSRIPWGKLWGKLLRKKSAPPVSPGKRWGWPKPKGGRGWKSGVPVSEGKRRKTTPPKEPQTPPKPLTCAQLKLVIDDLYRQFLEARLRANTARVTGKRRHAEALYALAQSLNDESAAAFKVLRRECPDLN